VIVRGLLDAGKDARTPAAVVSCGTRPEAASARGELAEIAALATGLASPALLVVGEVVALAAELAHPTAGLLELALA